MPADRFLGVDNNDDQDGVDVGDDNHDDDVGDEYYDDENGDDNSDNENIGDNNIDIRIGLAGRELNAKTTEVTHLKNLLQACQCKSMS